MDLMSFGIVVALKDMLTGPSTRVAKSTNDLARSIKRIEKVSEIGKTLGRSGVQLSGVGALWTGTGQQMRGAIEQVLAPAMEFEDSLAAVRTVASGTFGSVEADLAAVSRAARAWSLAHTQSAAEFARASYMMISAGLDTRQAIAGTETALAVATATMGDATQAASLLGSLYINLGDKSADATREMTRLGDVVTRTQQYFKVAHLGQLAEGLKYATPAAKQFGVTLEQLHVALGTLNTAGLEGSMAGTAFAAAMRTMTKASQQPGFGIARTASGGVDFLGTVEAIRAKFGDFNAMSDATKMKLQQAFGDEGLRAIAIFLGATGDMRRALDQVGSSTGVTAAAQRTMESTGSAAIRLLQNHFTDLKNSIAENLAPAIGDLTRTFQEVIGSLKEFVETHPQVVAFAAKWSVVGAAILAIVGPILAAGGVLVTAIGSGVKTVAGLLKAFTWLRVGGLAKLIAPVVKVGGALKWLGAIGWRATSMLGRGVLVLARIVGSALWGALVKAIPAAWAFTTALLANPITWIVLGIVALIAAIVALIVYWDEVVAAMRRAAAWVGEVWNSVVMGVKTALSAAWEWLVGMFSAIGEFLAGLPGTFFEAGAALFGAFWDGLKSVASSVVDWISETLGTIRSYLPFSDAKLGPLSDLTRSGRAFVQTWATGMREAAPVLDTTMTDLGAQLTLDVSQPPQNPGRPVLGAAAGMAAGRQITVQNLTIHVQAQDVQEQGRFVDMLTSIAEQYG